MNIIQIAALTVGGAFVVLWALKWLWEHLSGYQLEEKALQSFGSEIRDMRDGNPRLRRKHG
jgi:hypothetical protein